MDESVVLSAKDLAKEYDGVHALRWDAGTTFDASRGEIHAIVGENGAGKSTFMGILAGLVRPGGGRLVLEGHDYAPGSPVESRCSGVEIVLQEPGLIGALTVADNFFLGRSTESRFGFVRRSSRDRAVRAALAGVAEHIRPGTPAASLSLEDQKLVEIARAINFAPKVLLIDEMSACLGRSALQLLFRLLREQAAAGVSVLYISHYLDEVHGLCDKVTVFRDGRVVATLPTAEIDERGLTSLMVGREWTSSLYRQDATAHRSSDVVLAVDGLSHGEAYRNVSFEVRRGEILGIGGLVGCGSDPVARTLFGALRPHSGTMALNGRPYAPHSPRAAIAKRVAYVPPDRDREGLLLHSSIANNITLATLPRLSRLGMYTDHAAADSVRTLMCDLSIRSAGPSAVSSSLSGGNRQKVVLAKCLLMSPQLLVMHNPTRGIDVGAKAEIYALVMRLAERGVSVVLISDELPELIGMSDRILVMRRGEVTHEATRDTSPTEDELITHMV